jgi:CBS domain-containing protein
MKAAEVMTKDVISVSPDARVQDVAQILLTNRISAVPVVDKNGVLVGIVSESDLMRRAEADTGRHRPWWLAMLTRDEILAADYVREHSRRISDVMTSVVVTAAPETSLDVIADLFEKNGIKRVPIVKDGAVVGIVSRANLLQALMRARVKVESKPSDDALRHSVIERIKAERWTNPSLINVFVENAMVELWGVVDSRAEKEAVRVVAEVTPGVAGVNDHLIVRPIQQGI